MKQSYQEQTDIRDGAARGWVDAILQPHETRDVLIRLLEYVSRPAPKAHFHTGVIQVSNHSRSFEFRHSRSCPYDISSCLSF